MVPVTERRYRIDRVLSVACFRIREVCYLFSRFRACTHVHPFGEELPSPLSNELFIRSLKIPKLSFPPAILMSAGSGILSLRHHLHRVILELYRLPGVEQPVMFKIETPECRLNICYSTGMLL